MSMLLLSVLLLLLPSPSISAYYSSDCTNYDTVFSLYEKTPIEFASCINLPHLSSCLHYTYDTVNSTLSVAFTAAAKNNDEEDDTEPVGWISWGIGQRMLGAQCLIAFEKPDSTLIAATTNITKYGPVSPSSISYETWGVSAVRATSRITVFGTVKLPPGTKDIDIVWQLGAVKAGGVIGRHPLTLNHTRAFGKLNLEHAVIDVSRPALVNRKVHGMLNAFSWGLLIPIGAMMGRLLKVLKPKSAMWFYLHVACQFTGYMLGVLGWGTGLKLDIGSRMEYATHRDIGHALVALSTFQVLLGIFLRRDKESKNWCAWLHIAIGYCVIGLSVYNMFEGFELMRYRAYWTKIAYTSVICILAVVAFFLEFVHFIAKVEMARGEVKPAEDSDELALNKYNCDGV